MRVHTLDRKRRLLALILLAAQIVFVITDQWLPKAVRWLLQLDGMLGLSSDRDGSYWLLQGIASVITTAVTFSFVFFASIPFWGNYLWAITRFLLLRVFKNHQISTFF